MLRATRITRRKGPWIARAARFAPRVALLAATVSFLPSEAQSPRETYAKAVSHLNRREWPAAVAILREMVAEIPGNARLHNTLGIALSSAGEADAAAQEFGRALELEPGYPAALKNMALHEMSRNRPAAARPHFERLLEATGGDPVAHLGLAEIAFAEGDHSEAVRHFGESHGLLSEDPRLLVNFATALVRTGKPSQAVMALDRLPPSARPGLRFEAGLLLAGAERFEAAARQFEQASGGEVDPYGVGFNLVLAYGKAGQHGKAVQAGERLRAAGLVTAELLNVLSESYEATGETKQAYDSLREATDLAPREESNYVDLIALCLGHDNFDLGVEIADIAAQRLPDSHRIHLQRGVALAMKGRFEDAQRAFERSSELAPGAALPGSALGLVLMQQDRLPDAVRVLRSQLEGAPDDYLVQWFLAEALHRSGAEPGSEGEAEAVEALRRSIASEPAMFQSRLLLGRLLARSGELEEAQRHLEKARALEPDEVAATYQLALVHRSRGDSEQARELLALVGQQKADERERFARGGLLRIVREGAK